MLLTVMSSTTTEGMNILLVMVMVMIISPILTATALALAKELTIHLGKQRK